MSFYESLAAEYDRFVNWDARLAHELPHLTRLFSNESRITRILDSACGTGQHALALARVGYHVVGTDQSPAMIQQARHNAARQDSDVPFIVAGLGNLQAAVGEQEPFDAVLCLGNSLPHLLTPEKVQGALNDFAAILRPHGLLVIQNRNFDRVWAERERFMNPQSHGNGPDERIFVRFYDFHAHTITFTMIQLYRNQSGGWLQDAESTELRPVFGADLSSALDSAGFERVALYGSYDGTPFDSQQSNDLIAIAWR